MSNWNATFTDLRVAGIELSQWLEFHRMRRELLTSAERLAERW